MLSSSDLFKWTDSASPHASQNSRSNSGFLLTLTLALWCALLLCGSAVEAYIPALPTNASVTTGGNDTATAQLKLQWFKGGYSENVSYQLVGADSTGFSQGALVRFSEFKLNNDTTTTPWIALVSCDSNATDASQEVDIFTAAKERGAIAALLYSVYSERCIINTEYADPQYFDQVMDIFSSPNLASSQMIEVEYNALNQSRYRDFNATLLNDTASLVNATLTNGTIKAPNYLFATLIAANATEGLPGDEGDGDGSSMPGGDTPPANPAGPKSSLAMIILYAITGCVSALFCVVIVSGAIRAIRHPERYGPRAAFGAGGGSNYGPAQSRARGLTRAILDTFPVVKFGRADPMDDHSRSVPMKDVESATSSAELERKPEDRERERETRSIGSADMELRDLPAVAAILQSDREADQETQRRGVLRDAPREEEDVTANATTEIYGSPPPRPRRPPARASVAEASTSSATEADLVPDAIGRETCPICIVDFEEGDDLRVLPCEGHHRFHQHCVDPWLLELSSSCPLCRQDFHVLETMMSSDGHEPGDALALEPPHAHFTGTRPMSTAGARLSRYLKIARRTRRRNREGVPHGYDPTNPSMPPAAETSL
ncbi:hypothetical protein BDW22DRAFT_1431273 [Trametopsis cervina]|nr:hypothetical protein BDW22DRAFT_1431273 [Trametopsis cervina]